MNFKIEYNTKGRKDHKKIKSKPDAIQLKTYAIIERISIDPFLPGDSVKPLRMVHPNCYSRKISRGDRIVYLVDIGTHTVTIISLFGHYCDNGGRKLM